MDSHRASFFRKFTNVGLKPKVVRRIFFEDERDDNSDSKCGNNVTKLRHPLREEYDILEIQQTNADMIEESDKSNNPVKHLPPAISHVSDHVQEETSLSLHINNGQAPISQMSDSIQGGTSLNQVIHLSQTEDLAYEGTYLGQDIHLMTDISNYIQTETFIRQSQAEGYNQQETPLGLQIPSINSSISQTNECRQTKTSINQDSRPPQTEVHAQEETSPVQDIYRTQASISQTRDCVQAQTSIYQDSRPSQTEVYTQEMTSLVQDIHRTQASISQTRDCVQAETSIYLDSRPSQTEVHTQKVTSLVQDIHRTQASISQTRNCIQAETFLYYVSNQTETEVNTQECTSFVQDIHPTQTSISQMDDGFQTETSSHDLHRSLTLVSPIENYVKEVKSAEQEAYYGEHRSPFPKDDLQASKFTENESSNLSLKQPYKKRRLYERLVEMETCLQEIRNEDASTNNLIETAIVIDIEPEENTNPIEEVNNFSKKRGLKRNIIYKHIDFLSDSDEYIYSSSSWQDSDLESIENYDKKKHKKKTQERKNTVKDNNFDDTKENSEPKKKERRTNKNKLRSHLKNSGQQYTSISGKVIAKKEMKSNTCVPENCHNECYNISSDKRHAIFNHYWSLNNERRKDWLVGNSKKNAINRKRAKGDQSRRLHTFDYFINEGEGKRKVCLKFLLNTLDIKQKYLYNVITKATYGSSKEDSRGKHIPSNKTSEKKLEETRNYIKSLPYLPSHYCRKNSKRFYLPQEFRSLSNLFKIYKETMLREEKEIVGERVFQNIFREFNIGFHIPRKDKCAKCVRFEKEKGDEIKEEKLAHLKDKEETYERFQVHQKIQDENILCVSFDLQKVLNTPYGQSMLLYYSRKLAVYNLTFYESRTREGYCYSWNETEGKRGANEVCTILDKYIKMVDDRGSVKHLLFYSDACPGQNKNRIVLACIHTCLQNCKNISSIQMNYLLPGHTYMPVDSIHSVIEKSVTNTIIWAPSQWATVFALARKNPKSYHVQILTHKDFYGWDAIGDKYFKGNLTGKISKIRTATFKKSDPQKIAIKFTMATDGPIEEIEINKNKNLQLKTIYKTRLPISKKKYQDLWKLCTSNIIPEMYHYEYENFPCTVNIQDTLQDTDVEDNIQ